MLNTCYTRVHCDDYCILIIHSNLNYTIFTGRVVLVVRGKSQINNPYPRDCRIMDNRRDKKEEPLISESLFSAVIGAVAGVVVGYCIGLPKVGVAAGGLVGAIVGFSVAKLRT